MVLHEPRCRQNRDDRKARAEGQGLFSLVRCATPRAHDFAATRRDKALRAGCFVMLLTKGMAIRFVAFRASHPAKPSSRPCGTISEVPQKQPETRD